MATIPSSLDPTPARGLAHEHSQLNPTQFVREKSGAQTVTAGIGGGRIYNHTGRDLVLQKVFLQVGTAPVGADLIVDVNVGDPDNAESTAFSAQATRPKIVAGQTTGSAVPARAGNPVTLPANGWITVDVDQIGSGTAGSDLRVTVTAG